MNKRTFRIGASVACAALVFAAACDRNSSPTGPSATGTHIVGWVVDPVLRPLAGAAVRVLNGRLAGTRTDTDQSGHFELRSSESGTVTLEVSREGFKQSTYVGKWQPMIDGGGPQIRLESLEPREVPLNPGDYTVTFSFDVGTARDLGPLPPCAGFPADVAARTFRATVTECPNPNRCDRVVSLEGPTVFANPQLWLAIGARSISFGEMENPFTEEMAGFRYLNAQFGPVVPEEPVTVSEGRISVPATGFFQYCELFAPIDMHRSEQCQHNATLKFHACVSDNVRLVLTRR